ncbi:hypothetical protein MMC10_000445 [Thelotrema lepadinum]|nr:hypothetical protein [Thelotrema lepadinum]
MKSSVPQTDLEIVRVVSDTEHLFTGNEDVGYLQRHVPQDLLGNKILSGRIKELDSIISEWRKTFQNDIRKRAATIIDHITTMKCGAPGEEWPQPALTFARKSNTGRLDIWVEWVRSHPFANLSLFWEIGAFLRWMNLGWVYYGIGRDATERQLKRRWQIYLEWNTALVIDALFVERYTSTYDMVREDSGKCSKFFAAWRELPKRQIYIDTKPVPANDLLSPSMLPMFPMKQPIAPMPSEMILQTTHARADVDTLPNVRGKLAAIAVVT